MNRTSKYKWREYKKEGGSANTVGLEGKGESIRRECLSGNNEWDLEGSTRTWDFYVKPDEKSWGAWQGDNYTWIFSSWNLSSYCGFI